MAAKKKQPRGFAPSKRTDKEILAHYDKCGNKAKTVAAMRIGESRLNRILRDAGRSKAPPRSTTGTVDVDDLIDTHKLDYSKTLRKAVKEILVGNATLEPDKLRRYTSIPTDSWKELVNSAEFLKFQVQHRANRRRIWVSPEARAKLLQLDAIEEIR